MKKKLTMLLASLFLVLGTAWAQTRVLKLTDKQIGTTYPYALTDEDAAKVFGLTDLTIAVKVNTPASLSGRCALFCTSDPTQNANTSAMGTNSHYVAYGLNGANSGYLASCVAGDRYTGGTVSANTEDVVLVYVLNPTNNKFIGYINESEFMNRNFGSYEIATPKMVKEDYDDAKIYIGGGVKADNAAFETFNGTITGVEVYDGVLDAEQVKGVFLGPVVGQRYRLKNEATDLYMQANGTSNLQLQEKNRLTSQYFFIENATDGKYYLKSDIGPNRYVNVSQWNAVVNKNDDKTPYAIELVDGKTGVYALYQTKNANVDLQGNIGTENNTAGSVLYCNAPAKDHIGWVFEPVTDTPEVCDFDPNKKYRIRSEYSGLYMQLETTPTSGTTEGAFQIKELDGGASSQQFSFEPAGNNQYYLKTIKDGTTYYVNQGSWNFHAGESATTPFTIALVQGHTAVYSLYQSVGGEMAGYAGNNMEATDERFARIYCNLKALDYNTVWSFEEVKTEELEPTNLYALKSPTGTYFCFVAPTDGTSSAASFQNTPTFFYKEVSGTGYTFEDMGTPGRFIGLNGNYNVGTTSAVWNISAEDANGYVTISRNSGSGNLGHDTKWSVGTGIFTNVGSGCNKWQLLPAYPITITYKNTNDEVLETVKAATIAGTEYSFTVDTKGGTLVSCVADKGTMTETDGTYSFATVNGATTVTVTIEEPEEPVVFNPTPGKAYALKVKDQELYLNIRTLGIDDPNNSGSNNISLSARPFAAIYFEAGGTDGTWKMKNVNGKYVGVPGKGWNPMIGDASHDWTIVLEDGVITIAKAAGAYINANDGQVAAGNPLYCDKGTALEFELFDYDDVNFVTGNGSTGTIQVKEIHEEGLTKIPLGAGWRLTMEVESNGASFNQYGSSILTVGSNAFPEKEGYKGFQLYLQSATNGDGKLDAVFGGDDHIIDNVSYQDDFSLVVEYDGSSKITFTTVNELGNEATDVLSGSLPEIDVFSYGLPTGINIKSAAIQVFDIKYTFHVGTTPEGKDFSVTYNGEAVKANQIFYGSELNLLLFNATEIPGYTWEVVADRAANTLTLNYTEAEVADLQAVNDLVNRVGGAGTADKFMFVHTPWLNSKQETFVLGAQDGKIRIEGSTISAITTGIGWYLNNVAHINIAWNSLNEKTVSGAAYADLSNLPLPSQTETHTSDAKYRYYLNTCTFGYSMTSWTWKRWQQEIDWMALHGINMPLQLVGLEEVWRTFLIKCGYSETDAKAFVAGPAFIAWWAMNNLQGWGGTDPGIKSGGTWAGAGGVQDDAWYARQTKLAKQIVEAQRGLGMQPVLPGWSGMVPTNFADKTGYTTRGNGGNWAGDFVRPLLLNVSNANYAEIAADYYECLHAVMGESQYYSMDPFHEGGGAGTMEDYEALYAAMEAAKPGSQWVIQQWQWSATQRYSLTAVPAGRLIVLDLFSDGSPAFDSYNGYAPQEAVFCAIPNFGGRSGLMGRLQNLTDNYFKFKDKYTSIKGIGAAPEAIEQTPVTYDLIFQLPWMNGEKPIVEEWVNNYSIARYGKDNEVVKEAWSLLRQGPLNYGADGIQGPVEDVWAARPNLNANAASFWGKTLNNGTASNTYTKERRQMLIDAVYKLIDQEDELELANGSIYKSNYMYDLVEFGGAVMADYAYDLLLGIRDAKNAANTALYEARRDAFLQLILDMDAFRGTNLNFRLGKWTQEARAAAAEVVNPTSATPDWYEYNNARTIVSTWSSPETNLTDYSYRSWQGLLKDYYLPRWEYYFNEIEAGRTPNGDNYKFFEWNWAHGKEHYVGQTGISDVELTADQDGHTSKYTREPEGNTVEEAVKMLGKYIIPVTVNGTTHYAYRYLDNDVSNMATIPANAGATVDLTPYFGKLTGSLTSDVVDGTVTDLSKVTIKEDAADGAHSATITLNDGTKLTFYFSMNPKFNGVYTINYKNGNDNAAVFVGYNEDNDNDKNVGYKLIAEGTYSAAPLADKMFTIVPKGAGYSISAQGKYLKQPTLNNWNHIMFSDNAAEAGTYIFEETATADLFKLKSTGSGINYVNDYDKLVFGNDNSSKENLATFTLSQVESYTLTVSSAGMATLCLPFNVVLPKSVTAYDLVVSKIVEENDAQYVAYLQSIETSDKILKAGTPVIVKAEQGSYDLAITMSNENAVSSLANSLLKGNFVSQTLTQGADVKKFIFAKPEGKELGFYIMDDEGTIGANKCWMEWAMPVDANVRSLVLRFSDDATDIEYVAAPQKPAAQAIYNLAGQRLAEPQKGVNIINGKKVVIK